MDVRNHGQEFAAYLTNLLLTVLKKGKTAKKLWDHLKTLFQDNKGSRAAHLESKFVNLKFSDCASIDDYCDKLKSLSDRLSDLDFPMNDKRLVIQLVNGLPEEYNTVASFIQQSMPTFDAARSQLRTEEIRRTQLSIAASPTALATTSPPTNISRSHQHSHKRGQKSHSGDRRTGPSPTTSSTASPPLLPTPTGLRPSVPRYPPYWPPYWAVPPCPYPTQSPWQPFEHNRRPPNNNSRNSKRGISPGSGHGQAYLTPTTELLQPADIAEAYSSMHLQ